MRTRLVLALTVAAASSAAAFAPPSDITSGAADSLASQVSVQEEPLDDGVTVYYFHHTIRCVTCVAAEALADTLVHTTFASEVDAGELAWATINLDEAGNEQLADAYETGLFGLIVSVRAGGEEFYWRELKSIEDLTEYPDLYNEYVRGEIRYALAEFESRVIGARGKKEEDHDENAGRVLP